MKTLIIRNTLYLGLPYTAGLKFIDPVTTAAIIAGGSSLLSSIFGSSSSSSAAKASLQATRETNETNKQIAADQMAWQEDLINQQNEYNSAASQVERYREAGINPYMAMMSENASAGTQNQIASPVTPQISSGTEAYQYKALAGQQLAAGVSNAIKSASDVINAAKTSKEAEGLSIDNYVKNETALSDILKSRYASESEKYLAQIRNYESEYKGKTMQDMVDQQAIITRVLQQQELKAGLDNQILNVTKEIQDMYGLKMAGAEFNKLNTSIEEITTQIAYMYSEISKNNSQVQVNQATVKELMSQVLLNNKITDSYKIANNVAEQSAKWVVDMAMSQAQIMNADSTYQSQYNWLRNKSLDINNQIQIGEKNYQSWDKFFNYLGQTSKLVPTMIFPIK